MSLGTYKAKGGLTPPDAAGTGEETAACAQANAHTRKGRRHARGRTRACAKAKRNREARMQEPKRMRATEHARG